MARFKLIRASTNYNYDYDTISNVVTPNTDWLEVENEKISDLENAVRYANQGLNKYKEYYVIIWDAGEELENIWKSADEIISVMRAKEAKEKEAAEARKAKAAETSRTKKLKQLEKLRKELEVE